jgi:hypothetical protein
MAATKHRVKFAIEIDRTGFKRRYMVIKKSLTILPPHQQTILGSFTVRKVAEKFKTDCSDAYNADSEVAYRKRRG